MQHRTSSLLNLRAPEFTLLLLLSGTALVALTASAAAQIRTDGSVGAARSLDGSNVTIGADLGKQVGGNLFHSFQSFNVPTGGSATFSGPNSVSNIVGRVTGGEVSKIDGTIASTI